MSDNNQFSEREKEVTEHLLLGKSNKQIALALGISASTVEYHLKNVYKKLQVNSRTEAVLRLGKSTGSNITGELGKSTVEMNGETTDNDSQSISTWRKPMNKMFGLIGGGLLIITLVGVLVLVNLPVQSTPVAPTNALSLPDLTITSAYVSMVDNNGICLTYYGLNVTVVNQGNASALDVILADNTGQEVGVGNLNPLQRTSMSFVAHAKNGTYTVVADPHNMIAESDENNNTAIFSQATATPWAGCLPLQFGDGTPTVINTSTPTFIPTSSGLSTETSNADTGFTSKMFHVSLNFPSTWRKVDGYDERYQGNDGFINLSAKENPYATIQSVCEDEINHVLRPFGSNPSVQYLMIDNQEACMILPSDDQNGLMENSAEILIRYPQPIAINGYTYSFFILVVSEQYISSIAPTIKFDYSVSP